METIYVNGHTKESLEQEDQNKQLFLSQQQVRFNRMKNNHNKQEQIERKSFWIFVSCIPVALIGLIFHQGLFFVLAVLLAIVGGISMFQAGNKMEEFEGDL